MRDEHPDRAPDRRSSQDLQRDLIAAARALGYRPEAVARRNRISRVLVLVAVCLSAIALGVLFL